MSAVDAVDGAAIRSIKGTKEQGSEVTTRSQEEEDMLKADMVVVALGIDGRLEDVGRSQSQ